MRNGEEKDNSVGNGIKVKVRGRGGWKMAHSSFFFRFCCAFSTINSPRCRNCRASVAGWTVPCCNESIMSSASFRRSNAICSHPISSTTETWRNSETEAYFNPPGQTSVGEAVNGRCPAGYTNYNGQCCGPQSAQSQVSCSVEDSFGRCDSNQQCPEPGYACDVANNWCCPQVIGDAIGPCIQGEGGNRLCPEGYACGGEGEGQCFRLDTGTCPPEEQAGPCAPDGSCQPGYECIEGFCCQTDAGGGANPTLRLFYQQRRRRRASASAFLQMINYNSGKRQPMHIRGTSQK